MHELSLAHAVGEIAVAALKEQAPGGDGRVKTIRLRVGDLSGVDPEALSFCFEVVRTEWPETEGAVLEVHRCPALVRCLGCGGSAALEGAPEKCPVCGSGRCEVDGGRELEVFGLEFLVEE
jgi:hydrogenase nickel incorporation protein HypA/HybF